MEQVKLRDIADDLESGKLIMAVEVIPTENFETVEHLAKRARWDIVLPVAEVQALGYTLKTIGALQPALNYWRYVQLRRRE